MSRGNERFIRRARRKITRLMRSTCRIERPGNGEPVFNPGDGTYAPPASTLVYEGACQIKPGNSPAEREGDSGEREVVQRVYMLKLPWDASETTPVDIADTVTVTSSDETWLIGKTLPVAWIEYADSRIRRTIYVWDEARGLSNG